MKRLLRLVLLFGFSCALGTLFAQTTPKPASHQPPAARAAAPVPAAPPQLTEVEQLRLQNLQLKATVLQQQQRDLQNEFSAELQSIDAEHPGWTFNSNSGQFTPAARQPAAKPEAKK